MVSTSSAAPEGGNLRKLLSEACSDHVIDEREATAIVAVVERDGIPAEEASTLLQFLESAGLVQDCTGIAGEFREDAHYINPGASDVFREFILRNLARFPEVGAVPGQVVVTARIGCGQAARELFAMLDFRIQEDHGHWFVVNTPVGAETEIIAILLDHSEVIELAQHNTLGPN
jgi:hypothetical protein